MFNFLRKEEVFPSPLFLLHIKDLLKNTPDLAVLEQKKAHLLFVCDDFKKGHRRNTALQDAEYLGQGFTCPCFSMWKQNLGKNTFPLPFPNRDGLTPFSKISGEIWEVPTSVLKFLDRHRENTVQFNRMRVRVEVGYKNLYLDQEGKTRYISRSLRQVFRPWMYVANPDYWNGLINGLQFGNVTQVEFGNHFHLRHALREAAKYYQFQYKDYFDEEPIVAKRKLTPIFCDELGNQYTEDEWKLRLKAQQGNKS